MSKSIKVSDKVYEDLSKKKEELGATTYSEVINILLREFDD